MATTKIHDIGTDSANCIRYAKNNKVGEIKDDIADSISYVINEKTGKVVYETLSSYLNCNEDTVIGDFNKCMEDGRNSKRREPSRRKDGQEVVSFHLHQNFEGYEVDPVTANEIGRKLAEELLKGHPCVISTHTNTENIHNHIVFCAWNEDGKKYNDCHDTYRAIRKLSDKLCKEYGLSVLENTQEMKLKKYKDASGNIRYYEPTERKNNIIAERDKGGTVGGVGDYINSPSFDVHAERKEDNREIVKSDIDMFLPTVHSYEELLDRLREIGYEIRDKKKNGDWLKHISFKSPIEDKPTRDGNIGVGELKDFYRRENLTQYIEDRANEIASVKNAPSVEIAGLKYFDSYDFANINEIDDNYRLVKSEAGGFEKVERSAAEKENIFAVRKLDQDLRSGFDPLRLIEHIDEIKDEMRKSKAAGRRYIPKNEKAIVYENIQNSLRSLRFIERNNIYSFSQLNELCYSVKSNYEKNISDHKRLEGIVVQLNDILDVPKKLAELEARVSANMDNEEYMLENYSDDISAIASLRETVLKYKLDTEEGRTNLTMKVDGAEAKTVEVGRILNKINERIGEYENCIAVLNRYSAGIERDGGAAIDNEGVRPSRQRDRD